MAKNVTLKMSPKDLQTVSTIIAEKAVQMHKKGQTWMRGEEFLSCVDMAKIANKIQKPLGSQWDFETTFNPKKSKKSKK